MMKCDPCGVRVRGCRDLCPLCGERLSGKPEPGEEVFPRIESRPSIYGLLFRLATFFSIAGIILCFSINEMLSGKGSWAWFAAGGLVCFWLTAAVAAHTGRNLTRNMTWQLLLCSLLAVGWDAFTGWHGWSLDFVFPILAGVVVVVQTIMGKVFRLPLGEYLIYLLLDCAMGLLPLVLYLFNLLTVSIPSLLCGTVSGICLVAQLVFNTPSLLRELKRRFHF